MKRSGEDGRRYLLHLEPYLRTWWEKERAWHGEKVRLHGECRFMANDTEVKVEVFLSDGSRAAGDALIALKGKIKDDRIVGEDSNNGVEHELSWKIKPGMKGLTGIQCVTTIADYKVKALSNLLQLDLGEFHLSG